MSLHTESSRDLENQRQQSLQEYESQTDSSALDDFRPGTFGCHELLDRTSLLAEQVERDPVPPLVPSKSGMVSARMGGLRGTPRTLSTDRLGTSRSPR